MLYLSDLQYILNDNFVAFLASFVFVYIISGLYRLVFCKTGESILTEQES